MSDFTDPRAPLREAHAWNASLIDQVEPGQLGNPTPCDGWDVTQLLAHMTAALDSLRVMGEGGDPRTISGLAPVPDGGDWASAYRGAVSRLWEVWADDSLLDATFQAPWGPSTGAQLMGGSTMEALAHGWDLAVATGQRAEAPSALAEFALQLAALAVPADRRGGASPFAPVVASAPDAGPTERLANWLGRTRLA